MIKASLRSHLTLWFAGVSLLALVSVGLYVGHIATGQVRLASGTALASTAKSASTMLGNQLRERQLEVFLLSREPHLVRGNLDDPDILPSMELRTQSHSEYAWMGVADTEGRVHQAVNGLLVNQSVKERPWFKAGLSGAYTGDPHEAVLLAKLLPANASGELLRFIDFAAPIRTADGRVVGVLSAHVHWNWMTRIVESAIVREGVPADLEVLIVNGAGAVLYPQQIMGQQRPELLAARLHQGNQGWSVADGYVSSVLEVPTPAGSGLSWYVVVRQPLDAALQPAHILLYKLLALGVLAALGLAVVAYYLAQHLSRPIELLAKSAKLVQAKRTGVTFPQEHSVLEIAQLGQSIQSMTESLLGKERELQDANASLEVTVTQRTAALTQANAELLKLATHDALTGVYNRRRFDEKLNECSLLFERTGRPFALLFIDADHFKRVNDSFGHASGDEVLHQLARLIEQSVRLTDFVARYGGEEFAVLLQDILDVHGAVRVAENIRGRVADASFGQVGQVTVSIGIGMAQEADDNTITLIKRADQQLYQAKSSGRNRVACNTQVDGLML